MTRLCHLPFEILSIILRDFSPHELGECSRINHVFHAVTTPLLWTCIKLVTDSDATTLEDSLPYVGQYVRSLDVLGAYASDETLLSVLEHTPLLQHLFLFSGRGITDVSMLVMRCYCRHLTSLYLINTHGVTQMSFDAIGHHCHHLRHFGLQQPCQGSVSRCLFAALAPCPLQKLSLGYFDDDNDWAGLGKAIPDLARMVGLTHVAIWNGSSSFVHRLLTSVRWPKLTQLAINANVGDLLGGFLQAHPRLTGLDLRGAQVTDAVLHTMAASLPDLTYINLSHNTKISAGAVRQLVLRCPSLTTIDLMFCGFSCSDFYLLDIQWDNAFELNKKAINAIRGKRSVGDDDEDSGDDVIHDKHWSAMFGKLR